MGMSTRVVGLRNPEGIKHQNMIAAAQALNDVGIYEMPEEMQEYFNGLVETVEVLSDPYAGCAVDIKSSVEESNDRDMCADFIVNLKGLPEGISHIRFTNAY